MEVPYSQKIFGLIPWYSALIVLGILLCVLLISREAVRKGLSRDTGVDIALCAVPLGIIGARLYYVAFRWSDYASDPLSILYIWEGGVAIYGAVIGGALGIFLYARHHKLSYLLLLDLVVPGLVLAQALGRWGNYFNMEAYGKLITEKSLQFFPFCVLINGTEWHMATFFYEFCWNLGCFFTLILIRRRCPRNGQVFLWYLLLYGSGRFVIEQFRTDSLYLGGLRVSQWLSLLMCLAAALPFNWDSSSRKARLLRISMTLLLLARWFLTSYPVIYAILSLLAGVLILFQLPKKLFSAELLILAADLAGLGLSLVCARVHQLSALIISLSCSLTLCAQHLLIFLTTSHPKEAPPCPTEN